MMVMNLPFSEIQLKFAPFWTETLHRDSSQLMFNSTWYIDIFTNFQDVESFSCLSVVTLTCAMTLALFLAELHSFYWNNSVRSLLSFRKTLQVKQNLSPRMFPFNRQLCWFVHSLSDSFIGDMKCYWDILHLFLWYSTRCLWWIIILMSLLNVCQPTAYAVLAVYLWLNDKI